jgi:hypothetical protein
VSIHVARQELKDWVIMAQVVLAVESFIYLAFVHPDPIIVGAVCTAVPTILGLFHWFTQRDDKIKDAE